MNTFLLATLLLVSQFAVGQPRVYESASLKISLINSHVFLHETYLQTETFGLVVCNGMIYMDRKEAIVFDTPTSDSVSLELIRWIESQGRSVKAVVINHFHDDCLGGLQAFHERGIVSYANQKTIELAKGVKPQVGFDEKHYLMLGDLRIENTFLGEAHTRDNIVSYLLDEGVLFGGCVIKSVGASKGYLGDANTDEWSNTVRRIRDTYPNVKVVIPGHGAIGDKELLDYTVDMFDKE